MEFQIVSFLGAIEGLEFLFGFGKWKTEPVKLRLSDTAVPFRVRSARSVAIPLLSAVKENGFFGLVTTQKR